MSQKENPEKVKDIHDWQSQIRLIEAENVQLKQSLCEAKNLNDAIFKYNPTELIIVDREGHITGFSEAKARSGSRLPKIGDVMYRDYAGKHNIDMYAELMHTIRANVPKSFSELYYGDQCLAITLSPYPDGAVISCRNITQHKQAETALKKSEREKDLILSSVSEVVLYKDKNYEIRWANAAAADAMGRDIVSLRGEKCYRAWWQLEKPCESCPMQQIIANGQSMQEEVQTPDGRTWHRRGYPVRDERGENSGMVMVWLDVTEQKKSEMEKARIQAQLVQAQKMEAVGRLAGGVAHDFNNLLTAIIGGLDLTLQKFSPDDSTYQELYEIFEAAGRASELTRQLLLFSREHMPHLQTVCLNEIISNLLKMLHRLIGEDIKISTVLASDLQNIRVDKGTIEQVIMNLAVNARDAMPHGGELILRTENVKISHKDTLSIPDAHPGEYVQLSVSDSGIGISEEILSRIFEPFFTTKKLGRGTGLGLSVVYGIIKQHGGWISVRSRQEMGTTFEIFLPTVMEQVSSQSSEKTVPEVFHGNGERILIIEDEKIVRDFAVRALAKNGYEVFAAATGAEALEIFKKEKGRFDLIFSDVVLPDMNGIEILGRFLSTDPKLHVLISSGYTDTKSQWRVIREKGYRFLQKPYVLNDLFRVVWEGINESKG